MSQLSATSTGDNYFFVNSKILVSWLNAPGTHNCNTDLYIKGQKRLVKKIRFQK